MPLQPLPTDKLIKYWAVFDKTGEKQLTGWKTSKQRAIAAFRRSSHARGQLTIQSKVFVSRKETSNAINP